MAAADSMAKPPTTVLSAFVGPTEILRNRLLNGAINK